MARFFFDVLNTTGQAWDQEAVECAGRDEIEAHALGILKRASSEHDGGIYPVIVTVLTESYNLVLTAAAKATGPDLTWNALLGEIG